MSSANRYTTTELVADCRRIGHIPTAQTPFQDSDILQVANFELQTALLRQILSVRENYYLTFVDYDLNDDGYYSIPERAIGASLAEVQLVQSTTIIPIVRCEIHDQFATNFSPVGSYSFFIRSNKIRVLPNPTTGSIRLWYYERPNALVSTSAAARITVIASGSLTVDATPSSITTGTACDIIKDPPNFDWLSQDITPLSTASTNITFASGDVPTDVAVGDWVALAGQTPVPQIPVEFRPLLVQRVVVKYYEIQGYTEKMAAAQKKLEDMEKDVFMLINPRVSEEQKTINASSDLIGGYANWRRWLVSAHQ